MSFASRLDLVFRRVCSVAVAVSALALALPLAHCSDDTASGGGGAGGEAATAGGSGGGDAFASCNAGELEDDFVADPLAGPGVDGASGELAAGSYFVATTYLAMKPGALEQVQQLSGPVIGELMGSPGFVAFSTGSSESCLSLRTLTVWQSEEEMYAFVTGPAHATAMASISDLDRGSSATTSFAGTAADGEWSAAIDKLAAPGGE